MANKKRRASVAPTNSDYRYQLGIVLGTLAIMFVVALSSCNASKNVVDVTNEDAYMRSMSREMRLYGHVKKY